MLLQEYKYVEEHPHVTKCRILPQRPDYDNADPYEIHSVSSTSHPGTHDPSPIPLSGLESLFTNCDPTTRPATTSSPLKTPDERLLHGPHLLANESVGPLGDLCTRRSSWISVWHYSPTVYSAQRPLHP